MVEREHARGSVQISQKEIERAAQFGGADSNWQEYITQQENNYCDKGGHKERSIFHAPQHLEHWRKEQNGKRT